MNKNYGMGLERRMLSENYGIILSTGSAERKLFNFHRIFFCRMSLMHTHNVLAKKMFE